MNRISYIKKHGVLIASIPLNERSFVPRRNDRVILNKKPYIVSLIVFDAERNDVDVIFK